MVSIWLVSAIMLILTVFWFLLWKPLAKSELKIKLLPIYEELQALGYEPTSGIKPEAKSYKNFINALVSSYHYGTEISLTKILIHNALMKRAGLSISGFPMELDKYANSLPTDTKDSLLRLKEQYMAAIFIFSLKTSIPLILLLVAAGIYWALTEFSTLNNNFFAQIRKRVLDKAESSDQLGHAM